MPPKEDDNADAEEGALMDSGPSDAGAAGLPDEPAPAAPADDAAEDDGLKTVKRKKAPVDKDAEDKRKQAARNAQMRKWEVSIDSVSFQNFGDTLDPYLIIRFGGDYQIITDKASKKPVRVPQNQDSPNLGVIVRTEKCSNVPLDKKVTYRRKFKFMYDASYNDLATQVVQCEVWDCNWPTAFKPTRKDDLVGDSQIVLQDIAGGDITHEKLMFGDRDVGGQWQDDPDNADKKIYVPEMKRVNTGEMKISIYLQEIFTFQLNFVNWQGRNLRPTSLNNRSADPMIEFSLPKASWLHYGPQPGAHYGRTCSSFPRLGTLHPSWEGKLGALTYYGTRSQIESEVLMIKTRDFFYRDTSGGFSNPCSVRDRLCTGKSMVLLRGLLESGCISTELSTLATIKERIEEDDEETGETSIEVLSRKAWVNAGKLEGTVEPKEMPKFRQLGEPVVLQKGFHYLILKVVKASLQGRGASGLADPFFTMEWDNCRQQTPVLQGTTEPVFNNVFYYHIRLFEISAELLEAKGPMQVNAFDFESNGTNDFLGTTAFDLANILKAPKGTEVDPNGVTFSDTQIYRTTLDFGDDLDKSPNGVGGTVELKAWFWPPLDPEKIILDAKSHSAVASERQLDISTAHKLRFDSWQEDFKEIARDMGKYSRIEMESDTGEKYQRSWDFYGVDEYDREHFLPQYVTPVPCPEMTQDEKTPNELGITKAGDEELFPGMDITRDEMFISRMVNLIPFSDGDGDARKVLSPNFFADLRKGNVQDHCILLVNLLLGQNVDAYVCAGTKRIRGEYDGTRHFWVATRQLDASVTYWEVLTNQQYTLKSRWIGEVIEKTKAEKAAAKKDEKAAKKAADAEVKAQKQREKDEKNKAKAEKKKAASDSKKEQKRLKKEKREQLASSAIEEIAEDDALPEPQAGADDGDLNLDHDEANARDILRTHFNGEGDWNEGMFRDFDDTVEGDDLDYDCWRIDNQIVGNREKEPWEIPPEDVESMAQKEKGIEPRAVYNGTDVVPQMMQPCYFTLDYVYNHENLWCNLQHPDPQNIHWDIDSLDGESWHPFIGVDESFDPQLNDTSCFYEPAAMAGAMSLPKKLLLENQALLDLKDGIMNWRNGHNLKTIFEEKISDVLFAGLRLLEFERLAGSNFTRFKRHHKDIMLWKRKLAKLIPKNCRFSGVPVCFNTLDSKEMRTYIINNYDVHATPDAKGLKFCVAVRYFVYPNHTQACWMYCAAVSPIAKGSSSGGGFDLKAKIEA